MKTPDMNLSNITIVEHPNFAADEAWIVFDRNAPQVPEDLRDTLAMPCILTNNIEQTKRMLTFLQAVAVLRRSGGLTQPTALSELLRESDPLAPLRKSLVSLVHRPTG